MKVVAKVLLLFIIVSCNVDTKNNIPENNAPEIELHGESIVIVDINQEYVEPGFSAYDKEDGDLTLQVVITDNINNNTAGNYFIEYSVSDNDGKTVIVRRKIVIAPYKVLRNVFFFIGDGMGENHIKAASIYKTGEQGSLCFESFPVIRKIRTKSANKRITDSAAAATALSTGFKVNNGVISKSIPGDNSDLETILEFYKTNGFKTGLITTSTITHATPAAFGAHQNDRSMVNEIALDYFTKTKPNLLLGGGLNGVSEKMAINNGYLLVTNKTEMDNLIWDIGIDYVSGQFGSYHLPSVYDGDYSKLPHLNGMVSFGLSGYNNSINGLFLMIEGARIDHFSHNNDLVRTIHEVLEFSASVKVALDWASTRDDTLVIVTSDHETGGLSVVKNNGSNTLPTVKWSTSGHTAVEVNAYVYGLYSELFSDISDNTDFNSVLKKAYFYGR